MVSVRTLTSSNMYSWSRLTADHLYTHALTKQLCLLSLAVATMWRHGANLPPSPAAKDAEVKNNLNNCI